MIVATTMSEAMVFEDSFVHHRIQIQSRAGNQHPCRKFRRRNRLIYFTLADIQQLDGGRRVLRVSGAELCQRGFEHSLFFGAPVAGE